VTVLSLAYVPFLLGHLVLLRDGLATGGRQGLAAVLFLFAITWACDTFAYVVGRAVGRRPLWPQVSPNKTVEGALGGTVAALLAALGVRALAFTAISPAGALALGLVLAVTLQLGDLFESHLKRRAGVKDSSAMLPGHGGVLDRFDSMLFGAPVLFHVLRLL
jgi:phosphatidate cytidylyltransferase